MSDLLTEDLGLGWAGLPQERKIRSNLLGIHTWVPHVVCPLDKRCCRLNVVVAMHSRIVYDRKSNLVISTQDYSLFVLITLRSIR